MSTRVHELAKELGLKSPELLERIQKWGLDVKGVPGDKSSQFRSVVNDQFGAWVPTALNSSDYKLTMKPSEYWRRQCYATYQSDPVGVKLIEELGEDNIMWGSDFPHPDGPSNATNSPSLMVRLMPSSARTSFRPTNVFDTFSKVIVPMALTS